MNQAAHVQEAAAPPSLTAIDRLARRSNRLACVIEAGSRRRDVRELRAEIVLLLLSMACPMGVTPMKPWYVPGAVVRVGASGAIRAWWGFFGREAPALRTIRAHLAALEQLGVLVRSPGDWIPVRRDPEHPERRPRYPDTFHVLEREEDAIWWRDVGWARFGDHGDAGFNPDAWRKWFGRWRAESRAGVGQFSLGFDVPEAFEEPKPDRSQAAAVSPEPVERAAKMPDPLEALAFLRRHGVDVKGPNTFALARNPIRLGAALGLLARALRRGDRVANPAAWLVSAFHHAPEVRTSAHQRNTWPDPTRTPSP